MSVRLSERSLWTAAAVIAGALLLRHLWVCFHIHPYADDLSYAIVARANDLWARLSAERAVWNGRYFSNILMLRGPLLLPEVWRWPVYRAMPLLWIGLSLLGSVALLKSLTHFRGIPLWTMATPLLLCYLNAMPDAAEGIYWYTGAATYQLPSALSLFAVALAVRNDGSGPRTYGGWALLYLLSLMISGCNELHAVLLTLGWSLWALVRWRTAGRPDLRILIGMLIAVACLLYVITAPGNSVRGAFFPEKQQGLHTVLWTVAHSGRFALDWLFLTALLPLSLIAIPLLHEWAKGKDAPRWARAPLWAPALVALLPLVLSIALPFWGTGMLGQHRTVNVACWTFVLGWAWALVVIAGRRSYRLPAWNIALVPLILLCWGRDGRLSLDLLDGRLARYGDAVEARYATIAIAADGDVAELRLAPLPALPRSLRIFQPCPTPTTHFATTRLPEYFHAPRMVLHVPPVEGLDQPVCR